MECLNLRQIFSSHWTCQRHWELLAKHCTVSSMGIFWITETKKDCYKEGGKTDFNLHNPKASSNKYGPLSLNLPLFRGSHVIINPNSTFTAESYKIIKNNLWHYFSEWNYTLEHPAVVPPNRRIKRGNISPQPCIMTQKRLCSIFQIWIISQNADLIVNTNNKHFSTHFSSILYAFSLHFV